MKLLDSESVQRTRWLTIYLGYIVFWCFYLSLSLPQTRTHMHIHVYENAIHWNSTKQSVVSLLLLDTISRLYSLNQHRCLIVKYFLIFLVLKGKFWAFLKNISQIMKNQQKHLLLPVLFRYSNIFLSPEDNRLNCRCKT